MRTLLFTLATALALTSAPTWAQSTASFGQANTWSSGQKAGPLPEEEAFRSEVISDGTSLIVRLTPSPGYYLYRHTFQISSNTPNVTFGPLSTNSGEMHDDPHFGRVEIFRVPAEITVPVTASPQKALTATVAFQGCQSEGICYPPMTRTVAAELEKLPPSTLPPQATVPAGPTTAPVKAAGPASLQAEDQRVASLLADRPAWQAWPLFFGMGLLLGLTPCVLPMVPILLGLVAGSRRSSTRHTLALAGTYVLAHAMVFAALGAAAAWVGGGLQAVFQQAWILVPLALAMAGLGVVLLSGGSLQMPAVVQRWAGNKGEGGTWAGALTMGALSSLIIGPCVAPPLAGAVLYLAQAGDPWLGAGALFSLGLGMGVPMLAAAAGLGKWLPRSGAWADHISRAFGLAFVILAVWLMSRAMPLAAATLVGALALLVVTGWAFFRSKPHAVTGWGLGTGMAATLAMGWAVTSWAPPSTAAPESTALFAEVKTEAELDARLAQAAQEGKTVILDYYADWCTACLDMEKTTFSNLQVRQRLQSEDVMALKVDVTNNDENAKALMKRYGIIGPPATLFIQQNNEARPARLIGFEASPAFLSRLQGLPKVERVECQAPTQLAQGLKPTEPNSKPC